MRILLFIKKIEQGSILLYTQFAAKSAERFFQFVNQLNQYGDSAEQFALKTEIDKKIGIRR